MAGSPAKPAKAEAQRRQKKEPDKVRFLLLDWFHPDERILLHFVRFVHRDHQSRRAFDVFFHRGCFHDRRPTHKGGEQQQCRKGQATKYILRKFFTQ